MPGKHNDADLNWFNPSGKDSNLALLQDIRWELQEMNRTLAVLKCGNFLGIPYKLDRIEKNTRPRKRKLLRHGPTGRSASAGKK